MENIDGTIRRWVFWPYGRNVHQPGQIEHLRLARTC